jgi:hypothetical protein
VSSSFTWRRLGVAFLIEAVALPLLAVAVILLYAAGLPGMEMMHLGLLLFLLASLIPFFRARRAAKAAKADQNG